MPTLRDILARRASIRDEMRAILDRHPDGNLPDDARARCDELEAEAGRCNDMERRQALVDDMDRRAAGTPLTGGTDDRLDREIAKVGLLDTIRAQMGVTDVGAGRAKEISQELSRRCGRQPEGLFWPMERRADVITTGLPSAGPGSHLVATEHRPDLFIDRLRGAPRVRQLGCRVLGNLQGNLSIPKRIGSIATGWVSENAALSEGDMEFASVTATPRHCGGLCEWSRNMLLQSSPDVEALARDDLSKELARALDKAAVNGQGAPAPTGILHTVGVDTTSISSGSGGLTLENIIDLQGIVADADADEGNTGFLVSTSLRPHLLKIQDLYGRAYGLNEIFLGQPFRFSTLYDDTGNSPDYSDASVVYANWDDLCLCLWSELDVSINPYSETAYAKGNVRIRGMMSVDIAVRHAESFAAIVNAQGL